MRACWMVMACCVAMAAMAASSGRLRAAEPDLRSRLTKETFRNAEGQTLLYRLYVPKDYDAKKKYPLILFLHGAGERGNDNERQLTHAQVLRFVSDEVAAQHPCILVAPQCPADQWWGDILLGPKKPPAKTAAPSVNPLVLAGALLDSLEKKYSIDPERRYVTGLSMGGFGSYTLCLARPDYFAAAVPICGGTDTARAKKMAGVVFWIFHGGADTTVNPDESRNVAKALGAAGAKGKYTEYFGVGHDSWSRAYNEPGLVEWLFSQSRKAK